MSDLSFAPSATQRRVLSALKRLGEATADELAAPLEISPSAVRQHLRALRSAGFVSTRQERGHNGRPADRYRATDLAEPLFVTADSDLSLQLLEYIEEEDPKLVNRVFQRRRRDLVEKAKQKLAGKSIEERVAYLTELLDAQGYLADSITLDKTHYRINLHNCAMWTVANRYQQACTAELDFLRDILPDASVERIMHKAEGAHHCAYEISAQRSLSGTSLPMHSPDTIDHCQG